MKPLVVPSVSVASGLGTYITRMSEISGLSATYVVEPQSELHRSLPERTCVEFTNGSVEDIAQVIRNLAPSHEGVQTHGSRALLAARKARIESNMIGHVFHELPWVTGLRGWAELGLSAGVLRAGNSVETTRVPRRFGLSCFSVLPPILEKTRVHPRSVARQTLGLSETRPAIGVVGRLSPVKAPVLAVEAFAGLPTEMRNDCDLVFVGDGPLHNKLVEAGGRLGVSVRLLGHVPNAAELVTGFDVLVVPSPSETFGLSMAEALLANVPVAATRSPGSQLLLSAGASLDLASPNPADLARVIEGAISGTPADCSGQLLENFGREALTSDYARFFDELAVRTGVGTA